MFSALKSRSLEQKTNYNNQHLIFMPKKLTFL